MVWYIFLQKYRIHMDIGKSKNNLGININRYGIYNIMVYLQHYGIITRLIGMAFTIWSIYNMSSKVVGHAEQAGHCNNKGLGCWAPNAGHLHDRIA